MSQKLSTSSGGSSITVNVRGEKGQYFVGKLLAHKTAKSPYKDFEGKDKDFNIYEFILDDTNMGTQKKEGKVYVEAPVEAGSQVSIFASTRLNNALQQAENGQKIKIVYEGMVKAGKTGGKAHEYTVEVV